MLKKMFFASLVIIIVILFNVAVCFASDYYVSNSGNDSNSGTSQTQSWKTISKVNSYSFIPGDVIHFEKGGLWREQLVPQSGSSSGCITYTSYGNGKKPLLLGSIEANNADMWNNEGSNIWSFAGTSSAELLNSKSFSSWSTYAASDASIGNGKIAPNTDGYELTVNKCGTSTSSVQLYISGINIENGKTYKLSFRAKSSNDFTIPYISLMEKTSPWSNYFSSHTNWSPVINGNWNTYNVNYTANATDNDARITFMLGKNLPQNTTFSIDSVSLKEVVGSSVSCDVGNIIFNNGEAFGIKVWSQADLRNQNDFWYDDNSNTLKIYSTNNPASLNSDTELALTKNIINEANKSYINYIDLKLSYGGAHGIGGDSTSNITVKNCDISYIGGGNLHEKDENVRYGNGVEFFNNSHDNSVIGCNIWQIYDAALTNQGYLDGNKQYNIHYENNTISDCEYSFEYWNRGTTSVSKDIYFEKNTCLDAGMGWSHAQRPDKHGRHIVLWDNTAVTGDIFIRNNTIGKAEIACVSLTPATFKGIENIHLENNSYSQEKGKAVISWAGIQYFSNNFLNYQNNSGKDSSSKII